MNLLVRGLPQEIERQSIQWTIGQQVDPTKLTGGEEDQATVL
jgi:hypothetical protein